MAAQRKISIKTPLAADQLLIRSAIITERLGQPFEIEADLLSPNESVDFDSLLGKDVRLSIELDSGTRHFHAFIAGFAQLGRLGRYATYRARAVPWLWFLSRNADCCIFQNKNVPDIVKEVFREHGFTDIKDTLTKSYRVRDYCVQYRETDLNFVQRLMEEEGIYYYFDHSESAHKLVLADSYSGHEAYPDYETIEYFPYSENAQRDVDHIHDWHLSRNIQSGKYVATDYDFTKPRASLQTQFVQQRGVPKSDFEIYDYPGKYVTAAEGDHYVQAQLESLQAGYETVRGTGNARGLAVGSLFKLAGYPRSDQNREYLVVSATHRLDAGEYEAGKAARTEDYSCSFEALDAKQPFRCAPTAFKTRVSGPQTAEVVGPAGEEIYTDKYARVKVKFHWDRDPNRDENSSCWVRVSQNWAGKGWGSVSIPRIGQEVVVDFLEGDPDRPIITGRVYNQNEMPPYTLPGNGTQSGIKSRSSKGGAPDNFNEIRFEDKKGQEELFVQAEKNHTVLVKNDQSTTIRHDRTTNITRNDTLNVTGDQFIHIHGNLSMTVDGVTEKENPKASSKIKSSMSVTGQHNMHASDTIDMDAPNHIKLTVGGSSITITPGSIVLKASGGASITIDSDVNAKSNDGSLLTLDPKALLKASGGGSVLVDANILSKSAGGNTALVDATSVKLDATQIAATGGGSSLKLTPASADLKGAVTNVQGTGMVAVAAPLVKIN